MNFEPGKILNTARVPENERRFHLSFVFWLMAALALAGLDQATKFLAFRRAGAGSLGIFMRQYDFFNARFAFSLPVPGLAMAVIYFLVLAGFGYFVARRAGSLSRRQKLAAALILAGGISNVLERLITGGVRDFIYLFTGVLNLADFYILAGIVILLINPKHEIRNPKNI